MSHKHNQRQIYTSYTPSKHPQVHYVTVLLFGRSSVREKRPARPVLSRRTIPSLSSFPYYYPFSSPLVYLSPAIMRQCSSPPSVLVRCRLLSAKRRLDFGSRRRATIVRVFEARRLLGPSWGGRVGPICGRGRVWCFRVHGRLRLPWLSGGFLRWSVSCWLAGD